MDYPRQIHVHHKIANLIMTGKFVLTTQRIQTYSRLLQHPDVTIKVCRTSNPADLMPIPVEGEPHDCDVEDLLS